MPRRRHDDVLDGAVDDGARVGDQLALAAAPLIIDKAEWGELCLLADWLGLETVAPPAKGDLAGGLTAALARRLD